MNPDNMIPLCIAAIEDDHDRFLWSNSTTSIKD